MAQTASPTPTRHTRVVKGKASATPHGTIDIHFRIAPIQAPTASTLQDIEESVREIVSLWGEVINPHTEITHR